jgi:hypothetical protein
MGSRVNLNFVNTMTQPNPIDCYFGDPKMVKPKKKEHPKITNFFVTNKPLNEVINCKQPQSTAKSVGKKVNVKGFFI